MKNKKIKKLIYRLTLEDILRILRLYEKLYGRRYKKPLDRNLLRMPIRRGGGGGSRYRPRVKPYINFPRYGSQLKPNPKPKTISSYPRRPSRSEPVYKPERIVYRSEIDTEKIIKELEKHFDEELLNRVLERLEAESEELEEIVTKENREKIESGEASDKEVSEQVEEEKVEIGESEVERVSDELEELLEKLDEEMATELLKDSEQVEKEQVVIDETIEGGEALEGKVEIESGSEEVLDSVVETESMSESVESEHVDALPDSVEIEPFFTPELKPVEQAEPELEPVEGEAEVEG
ncbi:MAG: hypothetical protein DRJ38_03450 [Thermoprotei archaeon]|nr:MAG: hypothetical protein DRJ38_03450 [Thermoprotei archaeon]